MKKERTYHVGQRVMLKLCTGPEEYIIARPSRFKVALIRLSNGNRWSKVRKVEDSNNITQAEMDKMVDPQVFQGIVE